MQRCDRRSHANAQNEQRSVPRCVVRFNECRPGSAKRTVSAIPVVRPRPYVGRHNAASADDVRAGSCPALPPARRDRAISPCEARWFGSLFDFSPMKRSAAIQRLYVCRELRRECGARCRRASVSEGAAEVGQHSFNPSGMGTALVSQRGHSAAPLRRQRSRRETRRQRLIELFRGIENQPQQPLLQRHGWGQIRRNCCNFGPSCRCALPEVIRAGRGQEEAYCIISVCSAHECALQFRLRYQETSHD